MHGRIRSAIKAAPKPVNWLVFDVAGVPDTDAAAQTMLLDLKAGLTTHDSVEARTNAVLLERAERVVVVADSSKIGRVLPGHIASAAAMHVLVTDDGITTEVLAALTAAGVEVVIA